MLWNFCNFRKHFGQGGAKRIGTALPPLVVAAYQLAGDFYKIKEEVTASCKYQQNSPLLEIALLPLKTLPSQKRPLSP